jgi:hypothetical protein
MSDVFVSVLVAVGIITAACGCMCLAASLSPSSTQIEVTYTRNPMPPRIVVQPSVGSDEPEDPVDFSSNPKSSATSLGS